MDHRQRTLSAVFLTFVITLSIGFVTEYIRQSMTFLWTVEEGDEFIFDIGVTGATRTNFTVLPPPYIEMNNTQIRVEIISLPNVSIVFYAHSFIENIVEHTKTRSTFSNGTEILTEFRYTINIHISQCFLPIGGWNHLDYFFPNQVDRPLVEHALYLSRFQWSSFYFGYSENETYEELKWYGIIDLDTGVPQIVSFWFSRTSRSYAYWYNVTMSRVT